MSIIKIEIASPLKRAALAAAVIFCVAAAAAVMKWSVGNALTSGGADIEAADLAVSRAGDPKHITLRGRA